MKVTFSIGFVSISFLLSIASLNQSVESLKRDNHKSIENYFRIFREEKARESKWNFMAALFSVQQKSQETYKLIPICSMIILNEQFLLTNAHCIYNKDLKGLLIIYGKHDLTQPFSDMRKIRAIKSVKIHEMFSRDPIKYRMRPSYDVAIVEVEQSIPIGKDNVDKVLLTENMEIDTNTCVALGYGSELLSDEGPGKHLMLVYQPLFDNEICKKVMPRFNYERLICGGYLRNFEIGSKVTPKVSTDGDSGGALMCRMKHRLVNVLYGLVTGKRSSLQKDETSRYYIRYFLQIKPLLGWIKKNINPKCNFNV